MKLAQIKPTTVSTFNDKYHMRHVILLLRQDGQDLDIALIQSERHM